jgi:hypothetical protein
MRLIFRCRHILVLSFCFGSGLLAADRPLAVPAEMEQALERTCFQTGQAWSPAADLGSDVAIVYGIDPGLPQRIESWREHGYRIHVMTGVSWGHYQDYLYGRFEGINHEDEAQTDREGIKVSHGGDVYYMCPGTNYGKFLCVGVQRALDAGAEAIHLEEPEFWVRSGYSEGFKREWRAYYEEEWQPPHGSVDAQWRASKLKYFLYRRALQQVFDYVQDFNRRTDRHVRCYVPTHSLLNYAHWQIVSPESSLARLNGCDGYIAQVWTGTARTPNLYRGQLRERTFETAFLEYAAMQNLVRATGRRVWYLNDPVEDDPNHDWEDYRRNWESTLIASLLQPEVWHYEVAPWPERIFAGKYPRRAKPDERQPIPAAYATELQTVMNTLNNLNQQDVQWDCGTTGLGLLVSDSLMFERGEPDSSDSHLSHIYGLVLPLLKRGMPVTPVQLENLTVNANYLDGFNLLLLTYHGMKPLSADVHPPLVKWVKRGGILVVIDDDRDAYNQVHEWWNTTPCDYATPRAHLFDQLGLSGKRSQPNGNPVKVGKGFVSWLCQNPANLAASAAGDDQLLNLVRQASTKAHLKWRETNYVLLRRGPYVIAAGLDESTAGPARSLHGHFVNLFDPELRALNTIALAPASRFFLLDLDKVGGAQPQVLASACKVLTNSKPKTVSLTVEGVAGTPSVLLLYVPGTAPRAVNLAGQRLETYTYSAADRLLWIRFQNEAKPRELTVTF